MVVRTQHGFTKPVEIGKETVEKIANPDSLWAFALSFFACEQLRFNQFVWKKLGQKMAHEPMAPANTHGA